MAMAPQVDGRGPYREHDGTTLSGTIGNYYRSKDWTKLRTEVDARLQALEDWRYTWWMHWRELADYLLPRRLRWLLTANQWNRGSPINQRILDSTGTIAARTLASGMMSGITSPGRPWFRLTTTDADMNEQAEVKVWLADCTMRMQRVMAASNYYTAKAVQYLDLTVFGTAPMIIYADDEKVIRCYNPRPGEFYVACGKDFAVDTLFRKFSLTADGLVKEFGIEAVSDDVANRFKDSRGGVDREIIVAHAIEPNPEYIAWTGKGPPSGTGPSGVPRHFRYREVYWEWSSKRGGGKDCLRVKGYDGQPFSCPRWDAEGNDGYGRSPGMDALGDIKQLQVMQKRLAQAIDKMVNPPMVASVSMKNEPASLLPGAVNYVDALNANTGFRPAFQITPPVQELVKSMTEVQQRIKVTFFNDLFLMISQLDTVRTATEIDARREEKLVQLGPVLERFNTEGLDPDISRIFRLMWSGGMFAKMPEVLNGVPLKAQYVSVLADQQRAASTTGIERLFAFTGGLAGAYPEALDTLDVDEAITQYADFLLVPPKILHSQQVRQQLRAQRKQATDAQNAIQVGNAGVDAAKNLSETDVGGGQNALQMMLQGLGTPANGNQQAA